MFHFLTDSRQQQGYRDKLLEYLQPGGHIIMGCFNLDAPPQCSGLPVQRYDAELLSDRLGREFILKRNHNEIHHTPSGVQQAYLYCLFERAA